MLSNPPPYCLAALVVLEIWRVVVAALHAAAFTAHSPASAAAVPISGMPSRVENEVSVKHIQTLTGVPDVGKRCRFARLLQADFGVFEQTAQHL